MYGELAHADAVECGCEPRFLVVVGPVFQRRVGSAFDYGGRVRVWGTYTGE